MKAAIRLLVWRCPRAGRIGLLSLVLPVLMLARTAAVDAQPARVDEDQIKAGFLFNFVRFVEWPPPSSGPLVIAILGDETLAAVVERVVAGRTAADRPVVARYLRDGDNVAGSHLLYVSPAWRGRPADLLQHTRGAPMLTVGESVQFLRDGGIIRLYTDGDRMRFQINRENAGVAGLKISSHLLGLAR